MTRFFIAALGLMACLSFAAQASTEAEALNHLQNQWAVNNYQLKGQAQAQAFEALLLEADQWIGEHPRSAPLYTWRGIIRSTYAGVTGGLGALKFAKAAKADLEQALALDDQALQGSA